MGKADIHALDKSDMTDQFGRTFKTLRVSLTNTCNLACSYCVDPAETTHTPIFPDLNKKGLTTEQYLEIIKSLHNVLELDTIRLTGGEPTLYKELVPLVNGIKKIGIEKIKMTSNGTLLENKAVDLKNAGLTAINISLDALDEDVSYTISKRKNLSKILAGIDKAMEAGIPVKINCVVMKGVNDNQVMKLFEYGKKKKITVRFLELMQMGYLYHNFREYFFPEEQILKMIAAHYDITPLYRDVAATAKYWTTGEGYTFGVISNESDPFCNDCNRLRLDSYGNIYGCLSDHHPVHLPEDINDEVVVKERLKKALAQKKTKFSGSELSMLYIGG